ncbi:MAG: ABC transporter substrate-binding protein [Acidimicrobiaceae bacterium]|nr:ABC transporter substrate-binding protein [Acidimicrobiia bacterium]MCY4495143.1 ABC transporter substrate-binding protein [Acidimicrobiaceae bacterium]
MAQTVLPKHRRSLTRRLAGLLLVLALCNSACSSAADAPGAGNGTTAAPDSTAATGTTPDPGDDTPLHDPGGSGSSSRSSSGSSSGSNATPGVHDDRVVFGQSAAFSGPARDLGEGMHLGIAAAFDEVNRAGGVHGRHLELVSHDDAYEPEAAIDNTRQLIDSGDVFALIGAVGTPTSRSALPVAAAADIPYIAPFTGAAFLRDARQSNVINLRASYDQETEEMVQRLVSDLGIDRIGVMYQDDSFGRAGFNGVSAALDRRGTEAVAVGIYPRNTTAVKAGLLDLKQEDPEAVIVVGAYQPVAWLIRWAGEIGLDAVFVTISFVGSNALAQELGPDGAGVLTTQVVPFPTDAGVAVVASYLDALAAHDPDAVAGFVSLEGYLAGRLAIAGLRSCGPTLDRGCFLERFASSEPIDVDGFMLRYGDQDNQGSDQVFWSMIDENGEYRPLDASTEVPR